jgi:putative tricarboxylic transport membrane protein
LRILGFKDISAMDLFSLFFNGLMSAMEPANLLFALVGCIIGTLVGVLPGVGPVAGIAILLPLTYGMTPEGALIMLAAIYYGTMYGGTITSVLMNVPGESASVVTAIDGYQMARQGRAGAALTVAALGSFIGGTFATLGIIVMAVPLTKFAISFGPPEFFATILVGFALLITLAGDSIVKGIISSVLGLALVLPGLDPLTGVPRLTLGLPELLDGFGFIPILMGLFGISEILINVEAKQKSLLTAPMSSMFLTKQDIKDSVGPVMRGSLLGFIIGVVPGLGAATSAFISYSLEKRISRNPSRFGHGAIAGVAGPETANNASANAALLPLLTLGIPGSATVALIMGAFLIHGITPGPFLFQEHSQLVWTLIASMVVGNVILLVLNIPLIGLWTRILLLPYPVLFTVILVFTIIGTYSLDNSLFDVAVMLGFGVVGYVLRKLSFPLAPIALTLVLGPQFETSLGQSLVLSDGDFTILFRSWVSTGLIVVALLAVVLPMLGPVMRSVRRMRGQDSEV